MNNDFKISANQDCLSWKDEQGVVHGEPITSENSEEISRLVAERGY